MVDSNEDNSRLVTSKRRLHDGRFNWNAAEVVALRMATYLLAAPGHELLLSSEVVAYEASDEFRGGAAPDASQDLFNLWIERGAARPLTDAQWAAVDRDNTERHETVGTRRDGWVEILPSGLRELYPDENWPDDNRPDEDRPGA